MRAVISHGRTRAEAIRVVDQSFDNFFDFGSKSVRLTDQKKSWNSNVMDFSMVARAGFIAVPLSGAITVDDVNITIECELPAIVNNFIGEDKLRTGIEKHVRGLLTS